MFFQLLIALFFFGFQTTKPEENILKQEVVKEKLAKPKKFAKHWKDPEYCDQAEWWEEDDMDIDPKWIRYSQKKTNNKDCHNNEPKILSDSKNTSLKIPFKEFIQNNKYPLIIGSSLILVYVYYRIKLKSKLNFLKKSTNWSSWKGNIPLDTFYEIPKEKLLTELNDTIYQRYQKDRSDGPIEPYYLFFTDIKKEIKQLESATSLYQWLNMPIVSWFFPNLDDELFLAEEKIELLTYMENLMKKKFMP